MAKGINQKLKLLYLADILKEKTDETHLLNATELIEELKKYEVSAERKSIYSDIEYLTDYGMDIICKKGKGQTGYYLAGRDFELPELKLLVDAVQASRFITKKKSQELIHKLEGLLGKYDAGKLNREVYVSNRVKTQNESVYYSIDDIHTAMSENKKIAFQYYEWTPQREWKARHNGKIYQISPYALHWNDENYYLIGYDKEADCVKHYRVDKMSQLSVMEEPRDGIEVMKKIDMVAYTQRAFGMYGGKEEVVSVRMKNSLAGVVIDRFGKDVTMIPENDEWFRTRLPVQISGQFYGWLTGLGDGAVIMAPDWVKQEYKAYIDKIRNNYE